MNRLKRKPALTIFSTLLCIIIAPLVLAKSNVSTTGYLSIPLLYITDRASETEGYGAARKTEDGTSIYNLNCATVDFTLKSPEEAPLTDEGKQLGWREVLKQTHPPCIETPLPHSGTPAAFSEFADAIIATAKKTGAKNFFIIIHGYNNTFEVATERGAKLAIATKCPVIVYDWPSIGRAGRYDVDAENNEWSQEHFDRFLEELKTIEDRTGLDFFLVAHSMGNRLAVRSAPVMKGTHLFKEIFLVDPDFDAETFVHYMIRYAKKAEHADEKQKSEHPEEPQSAVPVELPRVRIFFSHKDHALPFAEFIFGGYTRLGQAADSMLASVFNPTNLTNLFADSDQLNKPAEDPRPQWLMKFEWIDYTVLDHGLVGHTIPFDLIANLWRSNEPGAGLKLVESENGAPNRLSRLFLSFFHQTSHISARLGKCEKVVFANAKK